MKNFGTYMRNGLNGGVLNAKKFYWGYQFVNRGRKNFWEYKPYFGPIFMKKVRHNGKGAV